MSRIVRLLANWLAFPAPKSTGATAPEIFAGTGNTPNHTYRIPTSCVTGKGVFLAFAAMLQSASAASEPPAQATLPTRPNIVFIFADDHALQAISAYNYRGLNLNKTPNIDSLAKEGAIFRNNFCANSICSPSRATVLTGKHSHLNGVTAWQTFDGSQFTFPKTLQKGGYHTGIFGKWHLISNPTGFDEWAVHPGQGTYYRPEYISPNGKRVIGDYATDSTTDLSLDFLKRAKDAGQPFLLMCQYKAPHRAWQPATGTLTTLATLATLAKTVIPEPPTLFDDYAGRSGPAAKHKMGIDKHMQLGSDLKMPLEKSAEWSRLTTAQKSLYTTAYQEKNDAFTTTNPAGRDLVKWKYQRYIREYLRCVESIDINVGRVLTYLKESGLDRNTIVVYSSDQGFYLGEHGWFDKRWMYEESFRMPLLVRWPGVVKPGTQIIQLTQNIDFAPTFLDAAGQPVTGEVQGRSLMPLLKGEPVKWRDALYYHYYDGPGEHGVAKHYGIRTERHKLIRFYADADNTWELYDLKMDPLELRSVYDDPAYSDIRAELTTKLEEIKQQYANPIHTEPEEKAYLDGNRNHRKQEQIQKQRPE